MKFLRVMVVASVSMLASGVIQAQTGGMMNGGSMWGGWMGGWMGGYGGYWGPILLVAVVGLIVWVVLSRRK
ncbi:MAG: hypothetical protein H7322_12710 [Ramlibacter sp.]|nr:hypothetical protein [Ramlibacter sp.]